MTDKIPYIRVFISSPGDVNDERKIALDVIEQLPYRSHYKERVAFSIVAWDKLGAGTPMRATLTPQEAINEDLPTPSQCDIVIVLFWSRMGTPFVHTDGVEYPSGTYWEMMDALSNKDTETFIYRRTEEPSFKPSDPDFDAKVKQYRAVDEFFKSDTFYDDDGRIQRGINEYEKPDDFRTLFEFHFDKIVFLLLNQLEKGGSLLSQETPTTNVTLPTKETETWNPERSPFPGLRAFTENDADIFFGRGIETDKLVSQLTANRFVAVIASSGSGKSSLVGAGLIPRLRVNAIAGSKDWKIVQFTPTNDPFNSFYNALANEFPLLKASTIKDGYMQSLRNKPDSLNELSHLALEGEAEWAEILLFIDQFEELFTLSTRQDANKFVALLSAIADNTRIRVVVTMRADFYQSALQYPELADMLRDGSFPLALPNRTALQQMIDLPAERAGITFEDGLIDRILDDVGNEPGNLALMAYALDELYKLDDDGDLTTDEYETLGGVQGAIGTRADNLWQELGLDDSHLRQVFLRLVEVDERGTATRRRADIGDDMSEDALHIIEQFVQARLLTKGYNSETESPTVEVSHEAILREWKLLSNWTDERQADFRIVARMRRDAEWWDSNGRRERDLPLQDQIEEFWEACGNLELWLDFNTESVLDAFIEFDEEERLIHTLATSDLELVTRDYIFYRLNEIEADMVEANLAVLNNMNPKTETDLRAFSADELYEYEDERAIQPLIDKLCSDDDSYVRQNCASSLGKLGDSRAIAPLIKILLHDKDEKVRQSSAEALSSRYLQDKRIISTLLTCLKNDGSHLVRAECAKSLGNLKNPTTIKNLIQCLNKDPNMEVRTECIIALGKLRSVAAVDLLISNSIEAKTHKQSIKALGRIKDKRVIPFLQLTLGSPIESYQIESLIALYSIDPQYVDVSKFETDSILRNLILRLKHSVLEDDDIRLIIYHILRDMAHPLAKKAVAKWEAGDYDDSFYT